MTSAARPTWNPAMGGFSLRDKGGITGQVSSRDLNSHTTLKLRQFGQNSEEEIRKRDLREELRRAEREHYEKKKRGLIEDDDDDEEENKYNLNNKKLKKEENNIDADDSDSSASSSDSDSDSDSSDSDSSGSDSEDDENETEELLKELEKIKREREEKKEQEKREQEEEEARQREEEILEGNPLLQFNKKKDFAVKRRWDDDVIFKNQAKGVEEKPRKRFVNDMLRSDFHRKFMAKYVK
ncbi:Cwf15/Cwc15 cell cycle control protein [Anaeromyces robustus]|uniref:Cwf15/Cwc15 cell cycle control protein n=1 Tax=Anaeromyces robustus TaxID=1754192 RepID=A0A1Y1X8P9_9FUNG|nr:Cwf15/Cwc15 cell cycle control protein [Anaeromyces robustus]|eukprot:ORX81724.1 Cwf15/Cwc15 cell cycle control protein [Anaeromyces robustus]